MEAVLEQKVSIDKTDWTLVKFGDVIYEPKESCKNPLAEGVEHVVGLEHIESENIHLKNSAGIEETTTFTKKFTKGDVLFGRRRAYLKKAAQAEFSGICSGDITVLRANDDLMPELLPFIVQNEKFFDYAIKHSAGGLSPRVKFKDLANYEFLLPPKDQQAKIAELLWAMDEVVEKELYLLNKLDNAYFNLVDNLFSKKNIEWEFIKLGKISSINSNSLNSKTDPNYEFKYLDLASIVEPKIIGELKRMKYCEAPSRAKRVVTDNSIVLAMVRPYQKAFAFVKNGKDIIASTGTAIIKMNDSNLNRFVFHQFFSKRFTRYCEDRMTGTSYPAITPKDVDEFKVSIPKNKEIIAVESNKLDQLEESNKVIRSQVESSKSLQRSLINQIF
ncbi:restriction endonuclease subunit S [Gilvibacter sediminis]|uniref:restriction endonuclease subunit S n=1 Tax=Gilvibacter sediminis TaxID=379071 RepID=UPI0023505050|nr:restriction endonuclease subunit S [Gilvibacter sediminis]MDC7997028.1 restriction endonuclease subunit S [Gilvibacter sediminis]